MRDFSEYYWGIVGFILKIVIMTFIILLFGSFVVLLIIESITLEYVGEIETKCYDKLGNEILNLTCKEEVYCSILNDWSNDCPIKEKK